MITILIRTLQKGGDLLMEIVIEDKAIDWFKEEVDCVPGDQIQFHVRYGGDSAVQQGFSLGFSYGTPIDIAASKKIDNILFFIESKDIWFFDDRSEEGRVGKGRGEVRLACDETIRYGERDNESSRK